MHRRRKLAWLVVLVVGLALIPAASASAADVSAASKASERKQNQRITKVARSVAKLQTKVAALTAKVTDQGTKITDQGTKIDDLTTKTDGIDGRVKLIEGGIPAVLDGLTKLKDGLTAAGDGLTKLKTLATSTEYGIGQVLIGGTPAAGSFVVTPDIPDAVQQAQASDTFVAGSTGVIKVLVGVRSAESDGTGAALPAAHCRVTVAVAGSPDTTTSAPNAGLGGAPFWPINTKSVQTSTVPANAGFPFGLKASGADADSTVDLTDTTSGTPNATAPTTTPATIASAGQSYTVTLSCVDTTPSADDPSA